MRISGTGCTKTQTSVLARQSHAAAFLMFGTRDAGSRLPKRKGKKTEAAVGVMLPVKTVLRASDPVQNRFSKIDVKSTGYFKTGSIMCSLGPVFPRPRGLTFTWWGCYGLCLT